MANLNDIVKVRLNIRALEIHRQKTEPMCKQLGIGYEPPLADKQGYARFELWRLMNLFGEHMFNGSHQLFIDNEVLFVTHAE